MNPELKIEYITRVYTPADFGLVCEMWKAQNWPLMPADFLPDTGMIVSHGDKPVCCGFAYESNSKVVWIEFIVADPTIDKAIRGPALDQLIEDLAASSKEHGYKYAMISTEHKGLIARMERHSFVQTDQGMTNLVRRL